MCGILKYVEEWLLKVPSSGLGKARAALLKPRTFPKVTMET